MEKALEFIPVKLQGTSHEESLRVCSCKVTGNFLWKKSQSFVPVKLQETFYGKSYRVSFL